MQIVGVSQKNVGIGLGLVLLLNVGNWSSLFLHLTAGTRNNVLDHVDVRCAARRYVETDILQIFIVR